MNKIDNEMINGREVIIWGAGKCGKDTYLELINNHKSVNVRCFIDKNAKNINSIEFDSKLIDVNEPDFIIDKAKDYYILICTTVYHDEIFSLLNKCGYLYLDDYVYIGNIFSTTHKCEGKITDKNNNEIIGNIKKSNICMIGHNSKVIVKSDALVDLSNVFIKIENNAILYIGENVQFNVGDYIYVNDDSSVTINNNCYFGENVVISCNRKSKLFIDEKAYFKDKSVVEVDNYSECSIGCGSLIGKRCVIKVTENSIYKDYGTSTLKKYTEVFIYQNSNLCIDNSNIENNCMISINNGSDSNIKSLKLGCNSSIYTDIKGKISIDGTNIERKSSITIKECSELIMSIGCSFGKSTTIDICENSLVTIGEHCTLHEKGLIVASGKSKIALSGYSSIFSKYHLQTGNNSVLSIKKEAMVQTNFFCIVELSSNLIIGDKFVCSKDVSIMCGDSHPTFNVKNLEISKSNCSMVIENHVWLGSKVTVVGSARLGESCIVGSNSVVGAKYPNNCLLLGFPARIVKKDIGFELFEKNPELICKEYIKETEIDK